MKMESNQFGSILRHLKFDVYQTCWGYFQLAGKINGNAESLSKFNKDSAAETRLQIEGICSMLRVPAVVKVIALPQTYGSEPESDGSTYVVSIWVNLDDE